MTRPARLTLTALMLLAACSDAGQDHLNNAAEDRPAEPEPLNPPEPGQPGGLPDDRTPITEGPIDPRSPQGAGQVLQRYFGLIEAGRRAEADRLWSDAASRAAFNAQLAQYREVHANIGAPGNMEGAAGSSFVDFPVQLYGRLQNGAQFSRSGTATLHRANDVPGATPEQLQWRIYRIELQLAVQPASYRFVGRWATEERNCSTLAWRFTASSLRTPAGSVCRFNRVTEVPGGYDIAAACTAESPPTDDTLELRFAESARALLFESDVIADAGLVRCR
jgi:hypothetical protein